MAMSNSTAAISGELKTWHTVTLSFDGVEAAETRATFFDTRLDVTFTHSDTGTTLIVPGYFAADGDAADTGATTGTVWRAHFNPSLTGEWTYEASFRTGENVAADTDPSTGTPLAPIHGTTGSFTVEQTDKTGEDFRAKGQLDYVGEHYLVHAETGKHFIKAGADSPENFLAYGEFDNTLNRHQYLPHVADWNNGDPVWGADQGKGIIGAVNYLAGKGVNSIYFLTNNVAGDGRDAWPWVDPNLGNIPKDASDIDADRVSAFDVSKLAQWEIVFSHMDAKGVAMHVVTQETENDQLLNDGALGVERAVYYRELIARFGHHNGVTWNLGEENTNSTAERKAFSDFFKAVDPYDHPVVVHTRPGGQDVIYKPMLGHDTFDGVSLQQTGPRSDVAKWIAESEAAGRPWIVNWDETGPANRGMDPDSGGPFNQEANHAELRAEMWGVLTVGGAGVEWYFGYNSPHNDLTLEDFRSRDSVWTWTSAASEFFETYLPVTEMAMADGATPTPGDFVFAKPGDVYAIYLPDGGSASLDLTGFSGDFQVDWFDPRSGGDLQTGSVRQVSGGSVVNLGTAPDAPNQDWTILVRSANALAETVTVDGLEDAVLSPGAAPFEQAFSTIAGSSPLLSVEILSLPSHGVLALDGVRVDRGDVIATADLDALTYTPADNYFGSDTIDWLGRDAGGAADRQGRLLLDIDGVNDAPLASGDTDIAATVAVATDVTDLVLANDTDVDGDTLVVATVGDAVGGTVELVSGRILFTADSAEAAQASFRYGVSDGKGGLSELVTVNLTVTDTPVLPELLQVSLIDSTTDLPLFALTQDAVIPGSGLPASVTTLAAVLNPEHPDADAIGSVEMELVGVATKVESVAPYALFGDKNGNFQGGTTFADGTYTLILTAYEGERGSGVVLDTTTLTFTVGDGTQSNANREPTATPDNAITQEDTPVVIAVLANDTDPDGDPLTPAVTVQPTAGTVEIIGTQIRYTPAPDINGTDTFQYRVSDPDGAVSDAVTVSVAVQAVNDAPVAAADAGLTATRDITTDLTDLVLANDTDVDGDALVVASVGDAVGGTVELVSGRILFTADSAEAAQASFRYAVSDGQGGLSDPVVVDLDVTDPTQSSGLLVVSLVDTITDQDLFALVPDLTIAATDLPAGLTSIVAVANPEHPDADAIGSVKLEVTGLPTTVENLAPYALFGDRGGNYQGGTTFADGTYTAVVTAYTGPNATLDILDTTTLTFTVGDGTQSNANREPTATPDNAITQEDTPVVIAVLANDTDPDGDPLTPAVTVQPTAGTVEIIGTQIRYTPAPDINGTDTFQYRVSDPDGAVSDAVTVSVAVQAVNDAPVAAADAGLTATRDITTDLTDLVLANDTDVDGDALVVASVGDAVGGTVELVSGRILFTADSAEAAQASFRYAVSDGQGGLSDPVVVDLDVTDPTQSSGLLVVSLVDTITDQDLFALVPDLTIAATDLPAGLTSIVAVANPEHPDADAIGSVKLEVTGLPTTVENLAPYALFGDRGGNYQGGTTFADGTYTAVVTAYTGPNATLDILDTTTLTFTVGDGTQSETEASPSAYLDFFLVDTANDTTLAQVISDEALDAALLDDRPTALYAVPRAGADPIGSVRITYDGVSKVESLSPFAQFGNAGDNFFGDADFSPGTHSVLFEVFSGASATGSLLEAYDLELEFSTATAADSTPLLV